VTSAYNLHLIIAKLKNHSSEIDVAWPEYVLRWTQEIIRSSLSIRWFRSCGYFSILARPNTCTGTRWCEKYRLATQQMRWGRVLSLTEW